MDFSQAERIKELKKFLEPDTTLYDLMLSQ